jgi:hypothetical protein
VSFAGASRLAGGLGEGGTIASAGRCAALPQVTAAHTWTAWTEFGVAPFACSGFAINALFNPPNNDAREFFVEVGVGPAGSERTVGYLRHDKSSNGMENRDRYWLFPWALASGERVAMRQRNDTGTNGGDYQQECAVNFHPLSAHHPVGCTRGETLGLTISGSVMEGTVEGAVNSGSFAAWTEIGTTTFPWRYCFTHYQKDNLPGQFIRKVVEYGAGPNASNVTGFAYRQIMHGGDPDNGGATHGPIPVSIPSGWKLFVRAQVNTAGSGRFGQHSISGIG